MHGLITYALITPELCPWWCCQRTLTGLALQAKVTKVIKTFEVDG